MEQIKEYYTRYAFIVWPAVITVISLVILLAVVIPQLLSYLDEAKKIDTLNTQIGFYEKKVSDLENINLPKVKDSLNVAYTVLPTDKDVPKTVALLQGLVNQSNLVVKNVSVASSVKVVGKDSFQINLSVSGPVSSIRNFLILLQNTPQIFQVESIGAHFQANSNNIVADIPLSVYYLPDTKVVSQFDQPVAVLSNKDNELLNTLSAYVAANSLSQTVSTPGSGSPTTVPNQGNTSSVLLGKPDPFQ